MKIQHQSPHLILFESALFRTTTSLIIGDDYLLLVDPNWLPIELDFIEKTIQSVNKNRQKYLLFTHSDYDHIIGYGPFKEYTTIASENFVNNEDKDDILSQIRKFDDEYYIKRSYEITYPEIEIVIAGDDQSLQLGSDEYRFFQARGHNKDGIITFNATQGILIAGDHLSNIEFPYIYDSIRRYAETLTQFERIIQQQAVSLLIPGHGDYTTDQDEMIHRLYESRKYLEGLTGSILEKKPFDEKALYERYDFPGIMGQFHQNNIALVKAELGVA